MKNTILILVFLTSALVPGSAWGKKPSETPRETYFVFLPAADNGSVSVHIQNHGKQQEPVLISAFETSGKLFKETSLSVPARGDVSQTIDISEADGLYCWLKVAGNVVASADYETISGDTLTTLSQLPRFKHPLTEKTVKLGVMSGIRHRYTLDMQTLPDSKFWVFVNLSEYPVSADVCQSVVPNCSNPSLKHVVQPMASIVLPLAPNRQYAILESSPGFSVATAVKWDKGMQKLFKTDASVMFDTIK